MRRLTTFAAGTILAAAATLPAWASSEGGGAGGAALLTPKVGTIFWTVLTFAALLLLLGRFAWKPLLSAIDERERSIEESFEQARRDREEAGKLLGEQKDLLAESRRERAAAVEQGKRDAEKVRTEILDEARQQRDRLLAETQEQVEVGVRRAHEELRGSTVDLAIQAASKLLGRQIDDVTQRRLVEEHLADLQRSGGGSSTMPH